MPELVKHGNIRFDWVIRKRRFVSFFDPREYGTRAIVDLDQVDAVDTKLIAFNDERDDINDTMDLLSTSARLRHSSATDPPGLMLLQDADDRPKKRLRFILGSSFRAKANFTTD